MRLRVLVALAAVAATFAGARPAAVAAADAGPVVVPLHVDRGPYGDGRLGIAVTVGSRTVQVLLDTGSAGLRVLSKAVGDEAVRRRGASASGAYATGLRLRGQEATARLTIGGATANDAVIETVDGFECIAERPNCPAANGGTPEMFGLLYPGILGVGYVDPPGNRCCPNPLEAFPTGKRFIVHAAVAAPTLTLGPDAETLKAFTMVDVPHGVLPRGCVRLAAPVGNEVCGEVLFDTGTPQLVVTTTGVPTQGPLPSGMTATLTVGTWSHAFPIGPGTGLRLNMRRGESNRIIVGLVALQSVDVFYDLAAGRIGLLSRG
jgi:hypothetical protein